VEVVLVQQGRLGIQVEDKMAALVAQESNGLRVLALITLVVAVVVDIQALAVTEVLAVVAVEVPERIRHQTAREAPMAVVTVMV